MTDLISLTSTGLTLSFNRKNISSSLNVLSVKIVVKLIFSFIHIVVAAIFIFFSFFFFLLLLIIIMLPEGNMLFSSAVSRLAPLVGMSVPPGLTTLALYCILLHTGCHTLFCNIKLCSSPQLHKENNLLL